MNTQSPPPDSVPPQPQQAPQPPDPRRRLRELLAVPERDRTDAQWDEIVELEIQTAPGNRATPAPSGNSNNRPQQQQQQKKPHFKGQGGRQKPRKPNVP
jgi:hypothetical protein